MTWVLICVMGLELGGLIVSKDAEKCGWCFRCVKLYLFSENVGKRNEHNLGQE